MIPTIAPILVMAVVKVKLVVSLFLNVHFIKFWHIIVPSSFGVILVEVIFLTYIDQFFFSCMYKRKIRI